MASVLWRRSITALVGVVALSYLVETILDRPEWSTVFYHAVVPQFSGTESVLLATGILGATVMPHVIFLHSALTQGRIVTRDPAQQRKLFRFELIDIFVAMGLAGLINMAMLIMAASTFFNRGLTGIGTIEEAHRTLEPLLGGAASWVFGISLLALRPLLLFGRNDGRPGHHGRFPPSPDSLPGSAASSPFFRR